MTRLNVSVLSILAGGVVALTVLAGCTSPDGQQSWQQDQWAQPDWAATWPTPDTSRMPCLTLDFSPPEVAQLPTVDETVYQPPADEAPAMDHDPAWAVSGNRQWRYIVIHHSATDTGNAALFHKLHLKRGWDELGYHFVITNGRGGPDGLVEVGPRWEKQKWGAHTGGTPGNEYNEHGIGICLVGNFTNHNPTPAQLASCRELVEYLMDRYDIPPSRVIAHRDAPNANTECCGRTFYGYLQGAFKAQLRRAYAASH
jgi:hypothetical protein